MAENKRQVAALIKAAPMLAGKRTAGPYAGFHYLASGLAYSIEIVTAAQIKTDQRMQIAVTRMEHVHQLQVVARADAISFGQHFRQTRPRHHGILNHNVGT